MSQHHQFGYVTMPGFCGAAKNADANDPEANAVACRFGLAAFGTNVNFTLLRIILGTGFKSYT